MVRQKNGTHLATVCLCCGDDVDTTHQVDRPAIPFCRRCGSGKCKKCWSWVRARRFEQDPSFNLIGRPRGQAGAPVAEMRPCWCIITAHGFVVTPVRVSAVYCGKWCVRPIFGGDMLPGSISSVARGARLVHPVAEMRPCWCIITAHGFVVTPVRVSAVYCGKWCVRPIFGGDMLPGHLNRDCSVMSLPRQRSFWADSMLRAPIKSRWPNA